MRCKHMSGSQAGNRRDVIVLKVYPTSKGDGLLLQVKDSSDGSSKTNLLDKILEAWAVPLNADSFTQEDQIPSIRFDNGKTLK